jgi:hypothetical protein
MHTASLAKRLAFMVSAVALITTSSAVAVANPFLGRWALTIPGGGAGWLGVTEEGGQLKGSILWGGGSVVPLTSTKVEGDTLIVTRVNESRQKEADGKTVVKKTTDTITAKLDGDNLKLTTLTVGDDGKARGQSDFTGKRIPPLPPAPDLARVKFGESISLFNGKDLSGWKTMGNAPSAWKVVDGLLRNDAVQETGKHKSYANLRTERAFDDFNLQLEFRVTTNGNSGVYLRGIYEVQVANSYGRRNDSHNCGALYSRIMPSENVSKPPGEWQTFDITLVDRHLTVIHNGKKTIDNQPVLGCTGGALWSDEFRPGPIYLQGDHTSVDYRNIVLRPVVK